MIKTADAVVIGGGINGCCSAYQLAKKGVKKVVLVEKKHIASGPTGRSSGVVRQHYSLETLAKMARDSVKVFLNFKEIIGGDAGFVQCGVVFMCSPENAPEFEHSVQMHQRLGIRETLMTSAELKKMEPELVHDDIGLGGYDLDGGYADPALAANSICEAAERLGVEVLRRNTVTGLRVEQGRIRGVLTDKGVISTDVAVNIAGPWGAKIAAMAGVEIPIVPYRHPVVVLQRPQQWRNPTPVWVDVAAGWYYKPEGVHGMMVGCRTEKIQDQNVEIDAHSTTVRYEETVQYSESILRRFPVMAEGLAQGGWAGIYDVTPDAQPVIDRIDGVEGFYCAVGFSGHGFKIGPAVGTIMAELVTEGACRTYDIGIFRHGRFRERKLNEPVYA